MTSTTLVIKTPDGPAFVSVTAVAPYAPRWRVVVATGELGVVERDRRDHYRATTATDPPLHHHGFGTRYDAVQWLVLQHLTDGGGEHDIITIPVP